MTNIFSQETIFGIYGQDNVILSFQEPFNSANQLHVVPVHVANDNDATDHHLEEHLAVMESGDEAILNAPITHKSNFI